MPRIKPRSSASRTHTARRWRLLGADGKPYESTVPGALGGYRPRKIYGRLDCPSALRHLARGHYAVHRVFFLNAKIAQNAGFRPCAVCLPQEYARWKAGHTRS